MKKQGKILIVDDDEDVLLSLRLLLKRHYESVRTTSNPHYLPRLLGSENFDVVLLDMNFSPGDTSGSEGFKWLKKIQELRPQCSVVFMTAYGDVEKAVQAMKEDVHDFITKPWDNEKLLDVVKTAWKVARSTIGKSTSSSDVPVVVGESAAMREVLATVKKVAKTDASVLILGENGTGKEVVARLLCRLSKRAKESFVGVDLGAVPDTLFESELFGYKKGAFTGAKSDKAGRFQAASGGTLFLDEIGNLSLNLQVKLLAALENRIVTPVGSTQSEKIDIRLIAATNMPLQEMVQQQEFRQDLLYRINTVTIQLPPLRHRQADIPVLAKQFLNEFTNKYQRPELQFSAEALEKLEQHHWPGNVRELRHAVERAVILSESKTLQSYDFAFELTTKPVSGHDYNLEQIERRTISKVLRMHEGNISQAAETLGLTRSALYRRIEKYGL